MKKLLLSLTLCAFAFVPALQAGDAAKPCDQAKAACAESAKAACAETAKAACADTAKTAACADAAKATCETAKAAACCSSTKKVARVLHSPRGALLARR
jgi:hypothetical protein